MTRTMLMMLMMTRSVGYAGDDDADHGDAGYDAGVGDVGEG